jgi:putative membrane protein insertion efficiency factor
MGGMAGRRKRHDGDRRHGVDPCGDDRCGGALPSGGVGSPGAPVRLVGPTSRTPNGFDRAVTGAIRGYRRVSPRLPTRCRYVPTCSAYGLEAVTRYGARTGLRLIVVRLARCRPGVAFGTVDPVP